jgi:hypothetical protein
MGDLPSIILSLIEDIISIRIGYYIRFHLICIGKAVGTVEDIHDGDDLGYCPIVETEPLHGGAVGVNSVITVVGN